jgi:hypothetical protein
MFTDHRVRAWEGLPRSVEIGRSLVAEGGRDETWCRACDG